MNDEFDFPGDRLERTKNELKEKIAKAQADPNLTPEARQFLNTANQQIQKLDAHRAKIRNTKLPDRETRPW